MKRAQKKSSACSEEIKFGALGKTFPSELGHIKTDLTRGGMFKMRMTLQTEDIRFISIQS